MTSKEIYDKTSGILAAIEECGCTHCIEILRSGLRPRTSVTALETRLHGESDHAIKEYSR